jgi:hypothetical protein
MSRRPSLLVRLWHDLTCCDVYSVDFVEGLAYEHCHRRFTGRLLRVKSSPLDGSPNFQPVRGA